MPFRSRFLMCCATAFVMYASSAAADPVTAAEIEAQEMGLINDEEMQMLEDAGTAAEEMGTDMAEDIAKETIDDLAEDIAETEKEGDEQQVEKVEESAEKPLENTPEDTEMPTDDETASDETVTDEDVIAEDSAEQSDETAAQENPAPEAEEEIELELGDNAPIENDEAEAAAEPTQHKNKRWWGRPY